MMFSSSAGEKAVLAQIKVETLETSVSKTDDWILPADVTLGLMFGRFGSRQPVQDRQPHHRLWFDKKPAQEVGRLYHWLIASSNKARPDTGLDITATEGRNFTQKPCYLNAVVKEKTEFAFVC